MCVGGTRVVFGMSGRIRGVFTILDRGERRAESGDGRIVDGWFRLQVFVCT